MKETPYGETATVAELMDVMVHHQQSVSTPILVRVIESPIGVDEEALTEAELRVLRESETRTFVLEVEDIEIIDGAVWLVVGEHPED